MRNGIKVLGMVLLVVGVLSLAYGGFTYVEDSHDAKIGPIEVSVKEKETVNIPVWAGVLSIVVGGGLLVTRLRS